jgi:flagellin
LAVKAATGSVTDDDRSIIQDEIAQLKEEITRIGETTEYNSRKLFDGTFDLKGYTDNNDIKVNYYSDDVNIGKYSLTIPEIKFDEIGNVIPGTKTTIQRSDINNPQPIELQISGTDEQLILTGEDGFEIRLNVAALAGTAPNGTLATTTVALDMTGIGGMTLQIGANEGQTIDLRIPELSLLNIGVKRTDVSTKEGAGRALDEVKNAISYVSQMRSRLGAYQNRLQHTQTNLSTSQENVTSAYSRIMDTDMAEEMTDYSNLQVVTQAATSILAQANERPSQVLQLLQ